MVNIKSSSAGKFLVPALTRPHMNLPTHIALIDQPTAVRNASVRTGSSPIEN